MQRSLEAVTNYWYRATDVVSAWPGGALLLIIVLAVLAVVF
jgi:hypothetical protein